MNVNGASKVDKLLKDIDGFLFKPQENEGALAIIRQAVSDYEQRHADYECEVVAFNERLSDAISKSEYTSREEPPVADDPSVAASFREAQQARPIIFTSETGVEFTDSRIEQIRADFALRMIRCDKGIMRRLGGSTWREFIEDKAVIERLNNLNLIESDEAQAEITESRDYLESKEFLSTLEHNQRLMTSSDVRRLIDNIPISQLFADRSLELPNAVISTGVEYRFFDDPLENRSAWLPVHEFRAPQKPPLLEGLKTYQIKRLKPANKLVLIAAFHDAQVPSHERPIIEGLEPNEDDPLDAEIQIRKSKRMFLAVYDWLGGSHLFDRANYPNHFNKSRSDALPDDLVKHIDGAWIDAKTVLPELLKNERYNTQSHTVTTSIPTEIAAIPLLLNWQEICDAIGRANDDSFRKTLMRMSKENAGPIHLQGQGKQPKPVNRDVLVKWWNKLAEEFTESQHAAGDHAADIEGTVGPKSRHSYGRNAEVVPGIGGSVKKRRSKDP